MEQTIAVAPVDSLSNIVILKLVLGSKTDWDIAQACHQKRLEMEEKKVLQVTTRTSRKWLKQTVQDLPTDYHPLVHCADDLSIRTRNGEVESHEKLRVEQVERVEEKAEDLEVEGISEEMLGNEEIASVEGEVLSDVEGRANNEGIKVTQFTTPLLDLEALQDGMETATLVK